MSKVDVWYQELFHNIAANFDAAEIQDHWDKIQPYRFIMTFKVEGFSAPKLEERLTDLMEQNILDNLNNLESDSRGLESTITVLHNF